MKRAEFYFLLDKIDALPYGNLEISTESPKNTIYIIKAGFSWGWAEIKHCTSGNDNKFRIRLYTRRTGEVTDFLEISYIFSPSLRRFKKSCEKIKEYESSIKRVEDQKKSETIGKVLIDVFPEILEKQIFGDD